MTTIVLLAKIRDGDRAARNRLWARYLPRLRRLVRGHTLPRRVRALHDVDDIVMRVIEQVDPGLAKFEYRREGAFMTYLRTVTRHLVISLTRSRQLDAEELTPDIPDPGRSPEDDAVRQDQREAFERALEVLDERQREAVVMRLEYGFQWDEIAELVDLPSANAARMMVERAILKMIDHMRDHRDFS